MTINQSKEKECQEFIRNIGDYYRSGEHNIGRDFIDPSFHCCSVYKRSAGYFTSNSLKTWASRLPEILVEKDIEIQLIISPELSKKDYQRIFKKTEKLLWII